MSLGALVGANERLKQIIGISFSSLLCHHLQFAQQLYHVLWRHAISNYSHIDH
jgi:hypothetical protein